MQSPYKLTDFVKIVSRFETMEGEISSEQLVASHRSLFDFLDNQSNAFYFIHDFVSFKYVMMSKSLHKVLGQNAEEFIGNGFDKVLPYFHPEDRDNIRFVHEELFRYFYEYPVEQRGRLRFDFNYRLRSHKGEYRQFLQQTIFSVLKEGRPLYDFSTATDISLQKKNNRLELTVFQLNNHGVYDLVHQYVVPHTIGFHLSNTELHILRLVAEGLSSKQIADKCKRSLHTINNHRRRILEKTQSNTLSEAIQKMDL